MINIFFRHDKNITAAVRMITYYIKNRFQQNYMLNHPNLLTILNLFYILIFK